MKPLRALAAVVLAALALAAPSAAALEQRYDHRDTHGPVVETLLAHDTVAPPGKASASSWRPAARIAWGFDALGAGDELLVGAAVALRSFDDPNRERVLLAADLRYRSYFGVERMKTFFDVGLWVPVLSRLAAGPLVGLGIAYETSPYEGLYLAGAFATGFGQARIASFSASVGAQFRFDLP